MADEATTVLTENAGGEGNTPAANADEGKTQTTSTVLTEGEEKTAEKQESKDDGSQGSEPKDSKADEGKADGAPENYESFKLPEGVEIDTEALAEATGLFKELGLSQEKAQKLIDLQAKHELATMEANNKAFETMVKGWLADSKADKEIGGDKFDENLVLAKRAMKEFAADTKFSEMLSYTGLGNHPEMIRFLTKIGKAISDDSIHTGQSGTSSPLSVTDRMFPTMRAQQEQAA